MIPLIHDKCGLASSEMKLVCVRGLGYSNESEKQEHFVSTELTTGSSSFTGVFAFHETPDNLENLTLHFYSCL